MVVDVTEFSASYIGHGAFIKTDLRGNSVWQRPLELNNAPTWSAPVVATDGSYIAVTQHVNRVPPPRNVWDNDWYLMRVTPDGDTLRPRYFGAKRVLEWAYGTAATPDNGIIVSGDRTPYAPQGQRRTDGFIVKFDSLLRMQWRVDFPAPALNTGVCFNHIHALANGHYLAAGYYPTFTGGSPMYRYDGLLVEVAPPLGPWPDTTGRIVGQWLNPTGSTWRMALMDGDTSALLVGQGQVNVYRKSYFTRLDGLPPAVQLPYCVRPVRADSIEWTRTGAVFTGQVLAPYTSAGAPHAVISRIEWNFGDTVLTGWQVSHTYAAPQPVGTPVRVRVINNLWCSRDTVLYPFGPPTGLAESVSTPTVHIFPNPSADGRFTVRLGERGAAPVLMVVDAVGRVVTSRQLPAGHADALLDLRAQPAGVYAARLRWPDGRSVTRRLVRGAL